MPPRTIRLLVVSLALTSVAPTGSAQVPIDDPDDPFSQRLRGRRHLPKAVPKRPRARAWLGVGLGPEMIKDPRGATRPSKRVAIRQVFPGSGAQAAGVKVGDIIVEIDRVAIRSVDHLVGLVRKRRIGDRLVIALERAGEGRTLTVKLGARPSRQQVVQNAWLNQQLPETMSFTEPVAGQVHTLKEFRGAPLIIEFWATYCGPCKRATPWLNELTRRYRRTGLQVIKISNQDPDTVRRHLKKVGHGATDRQLVLVDPNDILRSKLHLTAMPTFLYVDARGFVRNIGFGARSAAELDRALQLALNTPRRSRSKKAPTP